MSENNKVDLQLKQIVENIEASEREKQEISNQISEIYKNAKSANFCVKTIKKIIALRKKDEAERQEAEFMLQTYQESLGMK